MTDPVPERKTFAPSNPRACAACPWRTTNHDRPHPHGFYRVANLRRLWRGLRAGERMTCHPTDPCMAEFEGYEKTAERAVTHECTGSLVLIQRELTRFQEHARATDAAGDRTPGAALRAYRAQSGRGALTREGLAQHAWVLITGGNMDVRSPEQLPMSTPNLNDLEISHPDLLDWGRGIELGLPAVAAAVRS